MTTAFSAKELRPGIFDFYILSKGVPPEFRDDGTLSSYRTDLLNRWRRTLIRDIEYCLACELRHLYDNCSTLIATTSVADWFAKRFGEVGTLWHAKWASVLKHGKMNSCYPQTDDADFNADMRVIEIEFMSPDYFDLIKTHPGIGKYLSLGSNITFVFNGTAYRIAA